MLGKVEGQTILTTQSYVAHLNIQNASITVGYRYERDEETKKIRLRLQQTRISLNPDRVDINFDNPEHCLLMETVAAIVKATKNFLIEGLNPFLHDIKGLLEKGVNDWIDEMDGEKYSLKFFNFSLSDDLNLKPNPIIRSTYISYFKNVQVYAVDGNEEPYMEGGEEVGLFKAYMPQFDNKGKPMQILMDQHKLAYLVSTLFKNKEYRKTALPTIRTANLAEFFGIPEYVPCVSDMLDNFLPGLSDAYGSERGCTVTFELTDVQDFTINAGRYYSVCKLFLIISIENNTIVTIGIQF